MFAFANVVHLLANEFSGLRGRSFPLTLVLFGAFNNFSFGF
jgi:hypothetical protein